MVDFGRSVCGVFEEGEIVCGVFEEREIVVEDHVVVCFEKSTFVVLGGGN